MNKKSILPILDLKKITSSNNFKKNKIKNIPVKIGLNLNNGTIKLIKRISFDLIKTPHKWLLYNEPEFHLDRVSLSICKIINKKINNILCITYKDFSLAHRIKKILNNKLIKIFSAEKLFNNGKKTCIQSILENIVNFSDNNKDNKKLCDIIFVRHIWEHVYDQKKFLKNLFLFTHSDTIFYFEVPDCEKLIKKFDYTMIWEEHIYYYTQKTFLYSLSSNSFRIIKFLRFKQNYEDILCAVAVRDKNKLSHIPSSSFSNKKEILLAKKYAFRFNFFKKYFKKKIVKISQKGDIAVYGASHMFNIFFNIFEIEKFIKYIVDDNTYKQNKFMLERNVVIKDFNYLKRNPPKSCIIAINPMSNVKFQSKLNFLKKNNIKLFSIFDRMKQISK
jgi:predicted SAM-dependent methyltransferase